MSWKQRWYSGLLWAFERTKLLDRETKSRNAAYAGRETVDGVPLPPAELRVKIAGTADIFSFLDGGEKAAATIRDLLSAQGMRLGDVTALLDFGCGCGRVLRHWRNLPDTELHGVDCNAELAEWCNRQVPRVKARVNQLEPPVDYSAGRFDLIYAFSVLTHMPAALQQAWFGEFHRILRPSGYLIFSTHGQHYVERLSKDERRRFERGELVVRHVGARGTNYCNSFHPESWVRSSLAGNWEVLAFVPCGARGNPMQDAWIVRPATK